MLRCMPLAHGTRGHRESGATGVEYGLVLGLVALAIVGGVALLGGRLSTGLAAAGDALRGTLRVTSAWNHSYPHTAQTFQVLTAAQGSMGPGGSYATLAVVSGAPPGPASRRAPPASGSSGARATCPATDPNRR
jgi:Flp pilus assembly pilin Flp